MKKKVVMIICMVVMLITAMPIYAVSFSDINGHWAYNNIMSMANQGVVNGYEDGTFRPENMVTYGEFMKLVMCTYIPNNNFGSLSSTKHWAYGYVVGAEIRGLVPAGFVSLEKLDKPIDRLNMAKLLALIDKNLTSKDYKKTKELDFIDIGGLPTEYVEYLERIVNKGYIQGNPDKTFKPTDNLSRAEMVTILTRIRGGGV